MLDLEKGAMNKDKGRKFSIKIGPREKLHKRSKSHNRSEVLKIDMIPIRGGMKKLDP